MTLVRAGAPVSGTVTAAKGQGKFKGEGALAISLTAIGSRSVSTSAYEKSVSGKGKRSTAMIAGGGGAGALIGGLAGGGKGARSGRAIGAGAGTAGAAYTGNKNVVIPAESTVTFTLTAPIWSQLLPRKRQQRPQRNSNRSSFTARNQEKSHPPPTQRRVGFSFVMLLRNWNRLFRSGGEMPPRTISG